MKFDETTKFKTTRHVYAREFDGDLVLLDLARGHYYGLDPLGARLWGGVTTGRTLREIAAELEPEYDVAPSALRADLLELLRELTEKGLLEPA